MAPYAKETILYDTHHFSSLLENLCCSHPIFLNKILQGQENAMLVINECMLHSTLKTAGNESWEAEMKQRGGRKQE